MNRTEIIETVFIACVLIILFGTIFVYMIFFPDPGIQENNYWQCFDNEQLSMSEEAFEGTPITMKFTNLSSASSYYLVYFTMRDTVNVANFENVTEKIIIIEALEQMYFLMRLTNDETEIVMVIWINPVEVRG